jgi:intracellular multiplication protein IcmL
MSKNETNLPAVTNGPTEDEIQEVRDEIILNDQTAAVSAAVLRECAQLRLENRHLKRQNLRIWSNVGLLSAGFMVVIGAAFWWFPKYRYIPTTDNKAICEVNSQDGNYVTPATVAEFAKDSIINSYSYDYINYRKIIDDVTGSRYTHRGRRAFLKSLDESSNLERVIKGRLIMKSFATNAPQVETEGDEGSQHFWKVQVPMAIEFYVGGSASPASTQDYLATITVMQEQPSAVNQKGLAVDDTVLRTITRRN